MVLALTLMGDLTGRSGMLHVTSGRAEAQVYLREGEVVHAQLGPWSGEDALFTLVTWAEGDLKFVPGLVPKIRTIERPTAALLADLARRLLTASEDDWRVIRWIDPPSPSSFIADLTRLGEALLLLPPPG